MTRQKICRRRIESLRESFPAGSRVELVRMDDAQAPPIGTLGTVSDVMFEDDGHAIFWAMMK